MTLALPKLNPPFSVPACSYYVFAFCLLFGAPLFAPEMSGVNWLTWFFSAGCLLVLSAPMFLIKEYDPFQPLSFVTASAAIGITARTVYIFSSDDPRIQNVMLRDQPTSFLLSASLLMFLGCVALVAGYFWRPGAVQVRQIGGVLERFRRDWSPVRTVLVIVFLSLLAMVGIYLFVRALGLAGISLDNISAKRLVRIEGSREFAALGYLRLLMRLATLAYLFAFTWFAFSKQRWRSPYGLAIVILAAFAMFPPFFNSARTELLFVPILSLAIWNYARARVTARQFGSFLAAGLLVVGFMGALRADREDDFATAAGRAVSIDVLSSLVSNLNFMSLPTVAHMIEGMPEKLPFAYGQTLVSWVVAPIPRSVWPDKPDITGGTTISQRILGIQTEGGGGQAPPSVVGDLYWNFGVVGVVLGMFVFGNLLRFLYYNALPHLQQNPGGTLLYIMVMFPFVQFTTNGNFSQAMVQTLQLSLPVALLLLFVSRRTRRPSTVVV
jgi:oligosaccharide repeat unit polymerase